MKIEFVGFYPVAPALKSRYKKMLGTVHLYLIEEELDVRGILVMKSGKGLFFCLPYFQTIDAETGEKVRYPHIRFTNEEKHKKLIDFLHSEVKPAIKTILKGQGKQNEG